MERIKILDRSIYRKELSALQELAGDLPSNKFTLFGLVNVLSLLILSWEKNMVNRSLKEHPYILACELVKKSAENLNTLGDLNAIAYQGKNNNEIKHLTMEEYHRELFQDLWTKFSNQDYQERIEQYVFRLKLNKLSTFIQGKRCIDFGCGHGNFAHALINSGASYALGIDYGEESISYCKNIAKTLGTKDIEFEVQTVYDTGREDSSFDFAVQNGVFHHVDSEEKAYKEVYRNLKPGGWFWIYTDGIDSIQGEIQDAAARILSKFPFTEVGAVLDTMGLSIGKRYHLGDSLQATYRHTNLADFLGRLKDYGFGNSRRLSGGYLTDSDGTSLEDPWSIEKFGSGDIRLLVQKV